MTRDTGPNPVGTTLARPRGSALSRVIQGIDFERRELLGKNSGVGHFDLAQAAEDSNRCYACTLCERTCPVDCIEINYRSGDPANDTDERVVPDPADETALPPSPPVDLNLFDPVIAAVRSGSGLVEALHATQDAFGYLPRVALEGIATEMHLPLSRVHGVASFYGQFRLRPVGKHVIEVCMGTACHVAWAPLVVEAFSKEMEIPVGGTTLDGLFTLQTVNCLGACALAPVVRLGSEQTFGRLGPNEARRLVRKLRKQEAGL